MAVVAVVKAEAEVAVVGVVVVVVETVKVLVCLYETLLVELGLKSCVTSLASMAKYVMCTCRWITTPVNHVATHLWSF